MSKNFDIFAYLMGKQAGGGGGGGGDVTVESKSINANGTYTAPTGKAYSPVTVSVPASAVDSGTKSITSNGNNQDVVGYAAVDVAVPNSYAAGDEGKVVSNGALVAQTAHAEVTSNGTIDTTLNNSVLVNVSGGGGGLEYEEGTWTPVNDTNHGTILFQNTHTEAPVFYAVCDVSSDSISNSEVLACVYGDLWKLFGAGYPYDNSGTRYRYAIAGVPYVSSSMAVGQMAQMSKNSDDPGDTGDYESRYWAKETGLYPGVSNSSRYWKGGRTYKWFAIWKPST